MKKTSAYARKRKAQGLPLQGTSKATDMHNGAAFTAILWCRDRQDTSPVAGITAISKQAQSDGEMVCDAVSQAAQWLLSNTLPHNPELAIEAICALLLQARVRALEITFGANTAVDDDRKFDGVSIRQEEAEAIYAITDACTVAGKALERWRDNKQWGGLSEDEVIDLQDGLDYGLAIVRESTLAQMERTQAKVNAFIKSGRWRSK